MRTFLTAIILSMVVVVSFSFFAPASAQDQTYTLQTPFSGQSETVSGPADYLRRLYVWGMGLVALLAMARIVYAAIKWIASAGNTSAIGEAKDIIQQSLWGIALLAGAYLILYTINPNLVKLGALEEAISGRIKPLNTKILGNAFQLKINIEAEIAKIKQLQDERRAIDKKIGDLGGNIDELDKKITSTNDSTIKTQLEGEKIALQIEQQEVILSGLKKDRETLDKFDASALEEAKQAIINFMKEDPFARTLSDYTSSEILNEAASNVENGKAQLSIHPYAKGGYSIKVSGYDFEMKVPDKISAFTRFVQTTNASQSRRSEITQEEASAKKELDALQIQ